MRKISCICKKREVYNVLSKEKLFTKFVRAKAKTIFHKLKKDKCWVCGSDKDLELHHIIPFSTLIHEYLKENDIDEKTLANNPELRDVILNHYKKEFFSEEYLLTLCKVHHTNLHRLFGKTYGVKLAEKTKQYLQKQKEKMNG